MQPDLSLAAQTIRSADRLVVFTGAGMSADSGIATFRKGGSSLWSGIRGTIALAWFGTPVGWNAMPGWAWAAYLSEFYGPIARAGPHDGHTALASLEKKFGDKMTIVTMNVDGFHTVAGSSNVVEVHGTVNRLRCKNHGVVGLQPASVEEMRSYRCPSCGGYVRPDVVLFGESLPQDDWSRLEQISFSFRSVREMCFSLQGSPRLPKADIQGLHASNRNHGRRLPCGWSS
jgi:NAD-dependent deacetylase